MSEIKAKVLEYAKTSRPNVGLLVVQFLDGEIQVGSVLGSSHTAEKWCVTAIGFSPAESWQQGRRVLSIEMREGAAEPTSGEILVGASRT
jgi:hypothetical protein